MRTGDIPIADYEHEFPLIVVAHPRERVNRTLQRIFALGVTRNLAYDKLVQSLGGPLGAELQSSDD